jgi:very-short-patch-repair endonuclease
MQLPFHESAGPKTFENARFLKKVMTDAEAMLWEKLRNRKLKGYKFRRQHPIASYVADFYCHEGSLIVEVDGAIHKMNDNVEYDEARATELESMNIRVIRFTNMEVQSNISVVLKKILENLTSPPAPLLHGEGSSLR